jgi:hypothetical protein
VNEEGRKQIIEQLNTLRDQAAERLGTDPQHHQPVAEHVEQVRTLVRDAPAGAKTAHTEATSLEKRLLAWEAEHPQLVSLASRIARALEDAGLVM